MAKIMCPHCGSPNLDSEAACYDCNKPLTKPNATPPITVKAGKKNAEQKTVEREGEAGESV